MALPITISNKGLAVTISENGFGLPVVIVSGELPTAQAPALEGGALSKDGADLVVTAPVITAGSPTPSVNFTLTRGGTDVRGEVVNGRIVNAAPGTYVATWTASNGVGSPATATDTEVVSATAPGQFGPNDWELETGTGASELRLNIVKLPATGGSAITALEYNVDGGEFVALSGLNVGARVLTMPQGGTAYSVTVRAVNAVGAGTASEAKVATSNIVPAITATIDLQPAGQQSSITFNVAIDGSPTIAQGSTSITATRVGTTNQWTFTAPVEGPISFAATKAGHTAFSDATRTVAPALSVLAERNYELVIDNDPGSEPLEIIDPQEYAGVYDISDATYTNGMRVLAPAVISRTDDVITATRNPLFSWFEEVEPVQFSHAYYRGTTSQNAVLIAGTEGAASYTVDPALDGGKNVYRRDWIESIGDMEVGVFSNGIAVAAAAGWWNPLVDAHPGSLQVDYAGDRARINGVTYNSIAAAKSAGAILVDGTTEYTPITLGAACAAVGSGIVTRSTTAGQILFAADDGQDAVTDDNLIANILLTTHVMRPTVGSNGVARLAATPPKVYATGDACSVGISLNAGGVAYWKTLQESGSATHASMMPSGITRFCFGSRSVSNAPWLGTKKQFIFINGAVSNAELDALVGAIQ